MTEIDAPPASGGASKGMTMVAAYRAERLSQRAALRNTLHQSHLARRQHREARRPRETNPAAADPPAEHAEPAADPPPDATAAAEQSASVFAGLVSASLTSVETVIAEPAPASEPPPAAPEAPPDYDPPLAEIGFGPGMLIRLSQLGLHTTGELAKADAAQLRAALGDISRLVDVETWISNARQSRAGK